MEEWKEYKLGDFMDFNPNIKLAKHTLARKITMDQLIPHCRDIYSWTYEPYSGGTKFENGDTIMARITPCLENGKHAFVSCLEKNEVAYGSTEYIVMRGRKGVSDNYFVYYLSRFQHFKDAAIKSMVGTSGRQRAQVDVLKNLRLRLPAIFEQKKIASVLSFLDDKIDCNRRINDNLEKQAQALFKSWFVDFEPFKDGGLVESELGMIPNGWKIVRFDSFIKASSEKVAVGVLPEYSVTNNGIIPRDSKFNKQLSQAASKNKVLRKNDLVFGMSREILNWGIMEDEIGGVSSAYNVYIINQNLVPSTYLRLFMSAKINYFNDLIGTAAREGQSLDKGALMKKVVYVPPTDAYYKYLNVYNSLVKQKDEVGKESCLLTMLRDNLLPKLMSGELKTSNLML